MEGPFPMLTRSRRRLLALGLVAALVAAFPATASASHSWGNYHWARTANPFSLKVVDSVNSAWDGYLDTSISDWSQSSVLDLVEQAGSVAKGKTCKAIAGKVNVCNSNYGNNGWLGVASIWASGSHITQGTVKVNDTYFNTATYNTPAWRTMVMCQEIGHIFGLDHQDEIFSNANLGTCMDYTNSPGTNQHPNQGDYDQLLCIYDPAAAGQTLSTSTHRCTGVGHLDSTTTVASVAASSGSAAPAWGRMIRDNGRAALFVRDLGNGQVLFSFVIWAR